MAKPTNMDLARAACNAFVTNNEQTKYGSHSDVISTLRARVNPARERNREAVKKLAAERRNNA